MEKWIIFPLQKEITYWRREEAKSEEKHRNMSEENQKMILFSLWVYGWEEQFSFMFYV